MDSSILIAVISAAATIGGVIITTKASNKVNPAYIDYESGNERRISDIEDVLADMLFGGDEE